MPFVRVNPGLPRGVRGGLNACQGYGEEAGVISLQGCGATTDLSFRAVRAAEGLWATR